jgi:hypothetical protein
MKAIRILAKFHHLEETTDKLRRIVKTDCFLKGESQMR